MSVLDGLTDAQRDAVTSTLRLMGAGALGAAGVRAAFGAMRNAGPKYKPPETPKPIIVNIPVPAEEDQGMNISALRAAHKEKQVKHDQTKTAGFPGEQTVGDAVGWLGNQLGLKYTPLGGGPDAQTANDVPLFGASSLLGGAAGVGLGYHAADKLIRAAERRRAQVDLDDAKKEYEHAVLERAKHIYFPNKEAAVRALTSPDRAADQSVNLVKAAIDRAYEATVKYAATLGEYAGDTKSPDYISRLLLGMFYPGHLISPTAAKVNLGAAAALGGLGGYMGYRNARDPEAEASLRKQVAKQERDNATKIPAPMVARLVPVNAG